MKAICMYKKGKQWQHNSRQACGSGQVCGSMVTTRQKAASFPSPDLPVHGRTNAATEPEFLSKACVV